MSTREDLRVGIKQAVGQAVRDARDKRMENILPEFVAEHVTHAIEGYRPPARVITERKEFIEAMAAAFIESHWQVVLSDRRPWIITEDEHGNAWAWSWLEEDEAQNVKVAELLRLPVTVLWEGDA